MHNFGAYCNSLFGFSRFSYGGIIMGILGLILIGVIVFLLLKSRRGEFSTGVDSPLELLQKKYVNGEIDQEEYLEKKKILS